MLSLPTEEPTFPEALASRLEEQSPAADRDRRTEDQWWLRALPWAATTGQGSWLIPQRMTESDLKLRLFKNVDENNKSTVMFLVLLLTYPLTFPPPCKPKAQMRLSSVFCKIRGRHRRSQMRQDSNVFGSVREAWFGFLFRTNDRLLCLFLPICTPIL